MSDRDLTGLKELRALLGPGTRFDGKLTFEGRVRIDGDFEGEIFADDTLVIGDGAKVQANIEVGTLIVLGGKLDGKVLGHRNIELHAGSQVHADLCTPQLVVQRGANFEGKSTRLLTEGDSEATSGATDRPPTASEETAAESED